MIKIDGSYLEGGGQILRTALSLSAIYTQPFEIYNIRANRPNPGLQPQHLTAVNAVAKICDANVVGNELKSTKISFYPRSIQGGDYEFNIGTAGSITLLAQTLIPILINAKEESKVIIKGGTHVIKSPSFEYMAYCFLPNISKMGVRVQTEILKPGFYPEGGGEVYLHILPSKVEAADFTERGKHKKTTAYIVTSNLPQHVSEREEVQVLKSIYEKNPEIVKNNYVNCISTGNSITLVDQYDNYNIGVDVLGQKGKPAEAVVKELIQNYKEQVQHTGVDFNMVDQLMLYMALAKRGRIRYGVLSNHAITNIYTINKITGIEIKIDKEKKELFV